MPPALPAGYQDVTRYHTTHMVPHGSINAWLQACHGTYRAHHGWGFAYIHSIGSTVAMMCDPQAKISKNVLRHQLCDAVRALPSEFNVWFTSWIFLLSGTHAAGNSRLFVLPEQIVKTLSIDPMKVTCEVVGSLPALMFAPSLKHMAMWKNRDLYFCFFYYAGYFEVTRSKEALARLQALVDRSAELKNFYDESLRLNPELKAAIKATKKSSA